MLETVDLPVAREPVRPIRIIVVSLCSIICCGSEVCGFQIIVDGRLVIRYCLGHGMD